jgi:hypothetical protein
MKAITISACLLILTACVAIQPADPVCPTDGSWICEKSVEIGIAPETIYGWVFNAAAVVAVNNIMDIKEICDFENEIAAFYVREYPLSYTSLIDEAVRRANFKEAEKAVLIKNIFNQNLPIYKSYEIISEADDIILRRGHAAFRRDMLCYDD